MFKSLLCLYIHKVTLCVTFWWKAKRKYNVHQTGRKDRVKGRQFCDLKVIMWVKCLSTAFYETLHRRNVTKSNLPFRTTFCLWRLSTTTQQGRHFAFSNYFFLEPTGTYIWTRKFILVTNRQLHAKIEYHVMTDNILPLFK